LLQLGGQGTARYTVTGFIYRRYITLTVTPVAAIVVVYSVTFIVYYCNESMKQQDYKMAMTAAERIKKWREKNPEKARQSQKQQQQRQKELRAKKGPRQFSGNHPSIELGWVHVGDTGIVDDRIWSIYAKPSNNASEWWQVKICCNGKRAKKANFWLSWNGSRMAKGSSYANCLENIPELPRLAESILSDFLPRKANV
jgi:hypothetical protein